MLDPKLSGAASDCVVSRRMVVADRTISEDLPVVVIQSNGVVGEVSYTVAGRNGRSLFASDETTRMGQPILQVQ